MESPNLIELETVRGLVRAAAIADDAQRTVTWCLDRLPGVYADFRRDYNTRHSDEIQRLVDAVFMCVVDAVGVKDAITAQLCAMHERLGLPSLRFASPKPPDTRKRKAA